MANYLINMEYKPERRSQPHWAEFEVGFPTCKRQVIVADSFDDLLGKIRSAALDYGLVVDPPAAPKPVQAPRPVVAAPIAPAPKPAPAPAAAAPAKPA